MQKPSPQSYKIQIKMLLYTLNHILNNPAQELHNSTKSAVWILALVCILVL